MFGVCCVKNHDFTPKNHIFSNFRGSAPGAHTLDPPLVYRGNRCHDRVRIQMVNILLKQTTI
jgi:hypothetical protein